MDSKQDDLLKPTLRPGLDVSRFDRPWNPASLVYVAFFGGIAGGGTLYAINAKRLGMREEMQRIVLGTIALTVIMTTVLAWIHARSGTTLQDGRTNLRVVRFVAVIVTLLLARWMAKRQQPSYDAYDYSDRQKGKLWPYGIAAVVLGVIVHSVLFTVALAVIRAAQDGPR